MRGPVDAGARHQVLRAAAGRRLRQDPGRQHQGRLIATAMRDTRGAVPAAPGIGLRFQHHQTVLDTRPEVAWLEVHTENYMGGGTPLAYLESIRRDYPISLHGIGLSLGSAEGLDAAHLQRVRRVVERFEPGLVS